MKSSFIQVTRGQAGLLAWYLACGGALGCTTQTKTSELVVVVESDMLTPQDLDHVRLEVVRDGQHILEEERGVDLVTGAGLWSFPTSFRVSVPEKGSPAKFTAVAFKNGVPRIERSAVMPIPSGRSGQLRLALNQACDWTARVDERGVVVSTCADTLTCIDGVCRSLTVPETASLTDGADASAADAAIGDASMTGASVGRFFSSICQDPQSCRLVGVGAPRLQNWLRSPVGMACTGESWLPCGPCAVQRRSCQNGQWSPWSTCEHEGVCVPNEEAACNDGRGVMRCDSDCQWLACQPSPTECTGPTTESCDRCGTRTRVCERGVWSSWGPCTNTSTCVDAGPPDVTAHDVTIDTEPSKIDGATDAEIGPSPEDSAAETTPPRECVGPDGGFSEAGVTCDGGVCNGAGRCGQCVPSARQCTGQTPQTCLADGTWSAGAECVGACTDGRCSGICRPGTTQCDATGRTVQTCDRTGQYVDTETCTYVCSQGACTGSCVPGRTTCEGNTLRTCMPDGQWGNDVPCRSGCTNGACVPPCTPGTRDCNGLVPRECGEDGTWQSEDACEQTCTGHGVCDCAGWISSITLDPEDATGSTTNAPGAWSTSTGDGLAQILVRENDVSLNEDPETHYIGDIYQPLYAGVHTLTLIGSGTFPTNLFYGAILFFNGHVSPPDVAVFNSNRGATTAFSVQAAGTRVMSSPNGGLFFDVAPGTAIYSPAYGPIVTVLDFTVSLTRGLDMVGTNTVGPDGVPDTVATLVLRVEPTCLYRAP